MTISCGSIHRELFTGVHVLGLESVGYPVLPGIDNLSLDLRWVPSWANPSDAHSVNNWRTILPNLSRQLRITPDALPEAQVEVDRLLEPLSKGARAALQRLREKQEIP